MTLEDNQPIQLVFLSDGVERESVIAIPYEYSLSTRGKWEMIIANENKNVNFGEIKKIKIKPIIIPKNTIILPCAFNHNAMGCVTIVQHDGIALIETERILRSVQFLVYESGEIKKGDLLAVINVFPIMF